jgi:hypothetical protein
MTIQPPTQRRHNSSSFFFVLVLLLTSERARGEKRTTASAAATDLTNGLVQLLSDYPRLRFIVTTLGEKGSVWIEKADAESCSELGDEGASTVEAFVDRSYDQWSRAESVAVTATTSLVRQMRLVWPRPCAEAGPEPCEWFRVWYCPPQRLRPDEIVDTTGAGDAFTAATLFSLLSAELCGTHHLPLPLV